MHRRYALRDTLTPPCKFIETHLMPHTLAQQFRHLQHSLFGLSETEWRALEIYFRTCDQLGAIHQREIKIDCDYAQLASNLNAGFKTGELPPDLVSAYAEKYDDTVDALEQREALEKTLRWAGVYLEGTPVHRGLRARRSRTGSNFSFWLRRKGPRFVASCGAQMRNACSSLHDAATMDGSDHGASACPCCRLYFEHYFQESLEGMDHSQKMRFSDRAVRASRYGRKLLRAYAW
ncbi:hypothetical protein BJX70DRAFT_361865 [Aspergillus crustosus]